MGQGDLETKAGMKHQSRVQDGDPQEPKHLYPIQWELSRQRGNGSTVLAYYMKVKSMEHKSWL